MAARSRSLASLVLALAAASLAWVAAHALDGGAEPTALAPLPGDDGGSGSVELATSAAEPEARVAVGSVPAPAPIDVRDDSPRLAGRVVDDGGRPVRTFELTLLHLGEGGPRTPVEASVSDADGRFAVRLPLAGSWKVRADADGHAGGGWVAVELAPDAPPLELELERRAELAGLVLDASGAPVPRAVVLVEGLRRRATRAGLDGRFAVDAEPGPLRVCARAEGWAPSAEQRLVLERGAARTDVVLELRPGARLTVTAIDPAGRPAPGRRVALEGPSETRTRVADDEGRCTFESLLPGEWTARYHRDRPSPRRLRIAEREDPTDDTSSGAGAWIALAAGDDADLALSVPARVPVAVAGRVLADGRPWPGATVRAFGLQATTDADGTFALTLPEPGDYVFGVTGGHRQRVAVPPGPAAEVELDFPTAGVAGRLLESSGAPRRRAEVWLAPAAAAPLEEPGPPRDRPGDGRRSETDGDGRFAIERVPPGTYVLAGRCRVGWVALGPPIELAPGEHAVVADTLLEESVRLRGRVVDPEGRPVEGAWVQPTAPLGDSQPLGPTGADGAFGERRVPPGRLDVLVAHADLSLAHIERLELAPHEVRDVRWTLRPATRLAIEVEDGSGRLADADVWLSTADGTPLSRFPAIGGVPLARPAAIRTSGPLPPGAYRVRARLPDGRTLEATVETAGEEVLPVRLRPGP